jgi:hypothetical protein
MVLVVAASLLSSASALAGNVTILNPNFALDVITQNGGAYNSGAVDWNNGGGGVLSTLPQYFGGVLTPSSPADTENQNAWSNGGTFDQVLTATLHANTTYTLSAYVGERSDTGAWPGAALDLGYGAGGGSNLLTPNTTTAPQPPAGGWQLWTTTFVTGASPAGLGQPLRVDLVANGIQVQFDSVQLNATPEPSSIVLYSLGALGLLVAARRRRA